MQSTPAPDIPVPSPWVRRFLPLIPAGGRVLDLAAGQGRHTRLLRANGYQVVAVDRDAAALRAAVAADAAIEIIEADLEDGGPWRLGHGYDGIVVTNYLHRPLLPALAAALAPGGALIYETFMAGNERFGRPANPDFLLLPGELLAAFIDRLTVAAFEQGRVTAPRPAVIQRIAAVKGEAGLLPPA
ncbi:MAG TPA: methyltransferase domain-containing protein [Stellaceae bacterium]|nr:methyltransferase domain-containing protein [Stellaceae bacterium]